MKRELKSIAQSVQPVAVPPEFDRDPAAWLAEQAGALKLRWVLAHADDGVVWGEVVDRKVRLSGDVFPAVSPPLRAITLQQVRLFGENGELLIWRGMAGWQARQITEGMGSGVEVFDEPQLLWGTHVEQVKDGFALLREGAEGLRHAPPVHAEAGEAGTLPRRLTLTVRHTIRYDDDGQAYIALVRLVRLGLID